MRKRDCRTEDCDVGDWQMQRGQKRNKLQLMLLKVATVFSYGLRGHSKYKNNAVLIEFPDDGSVFR